MGSENKNGKVPVSYTHLDVYKRQGLDLEKVPMYGFSLKRQYLRQQQGILDFSY